MCLFVSLDLWYVDDLASLFPRRPGCVSLNRPPPIAARSEPTPRAWCVADPVRALAGSTLRAAGVDSLIIKELMATNLWPPQRSTSRLRMQSSAVRLLPILEGGTGPRLMNVGEIRRPD